MSNDGDALPAMRLHRMWDRLRQAGFDHEQIEQIRTCLRDTIDNDTTRIGSVCDVEGCNRILGHTDHSSGLHTLACIDHGVRESTFGLHSGFALAIKFPPVLP